VPTLGIYVGLRLSALAASKPAWPRGVKVRGFGVFLQRETGKETPLCSCYRETLHLGGYCFTSTFISMGGEGNGNHLAPGVGRGEGAPGGGGGEGQAVPTGSTPDSRQPGPRKRRDL
jgi:hypothetical protein